MANPDLLNNLTSEEHSERPVLCNSLLHKELFFAFLIESVCYNFVSKDILHKVLFNYGLKWIAIDSMLLHNLQDGP